MDAYRCLDPTQNCGMDAYRALSGQQSIHTARGGLGSDGYAADAGAELHDEGIDLVAAIADRERAGAYRVIRRSANGGVSEEPLEVAYLTW